MSLGHLIISRSFSTARALFRPALSANYKSKQLWDERFNCRLLGGDADLIKVINSKILSESELNNLEVDIFINIAAPRVEEIAHLREASKTLKEFRKTLYAHTLLPSTHHALCRLFMDNERTTSLVSLLERRVEFGVFPDSFCFNLIFDKLLEQQKYAQASRVAALIMLQEEFGLNNISDTFALYSVAKYIESKGNFSDWNELDFSNDPIFIAENSSDITATSDQTQKKEEAELGDEEEDEEEVQYIRIPFLRNPYFDDHFDLQNPRVICGKTLSMIGAKLDDKNLGIKCMALGRTLEGKWSEAKNLLEKLVQSKVESTAIKELLIYYIENLHDVMEPEDLRDSLIYLAKALPEGGSTLSKQAEQQSREFESRELKDIHELKSNLVAWSETRIATKKSIEGYLARQKLIEEIKAKKRALKEREEFLYFYENLKKSSLTRIDYD